MFSETYPLRWCCSQLRFFFPVAQATSRQDYEHHQHPKAEHSIWTAMEGMCHKILRFCKKGVYVNPWAALSCTP